MLNVSRILFFIFCLYFAQGFAGASSESGAFNPCPECISSDRTASEVRALSTVACEQVINSEECQGVNPKYLRDCEEEEESSLAFGQRVLGCMKGAALEGAIGLGVGAVLGKVIVGIGALLSLPVVGAALGITAGGGAALYVFSEYDRAYQEVGEGEGRAMRAMGHLLGEVGTGAYRLLLGNYECYSSEGRAWEVCGLLLGGVATGGAATMVATAKKAAKKATAVTENPIKAQALREISEREAEVTRFILDKKTGYKIYYSHGYDNARWLSGLSRMRNIQHGEWEHFLKGAREAEVSLKEALTARKATMEGAMGGIRPRSWASYVKSMDGSSVFQPLLKGREGIALYRNLDERALFSYIDRKKAFEKATGHRLNTNQQSVLADLQAAGLKKSQGQTPVEYDDVVKMIKTEGMSPEKFRQMVDKDLISTDEAINKEIRSLIDQYEMLQ